MRRTQAARLGKVPPVSITGKRGVPPTKTPGLVASDPIICGEVSDGMVEQLVRATGMIFGIRANQQRWVIGDEVDDAVADGLLVVVLERAPTPVVRATNLPDGAPGSSPDLPAGIDQWTRAFTTCLRCREAPAGPGSELCEDCQLAELEDPAETPLAKALRLAGT